MNSDNVSAAGNDSHYEVIVLKAGYSRMVKGTMVANGTSTLIKGPKNIVVDTLSPWDRDFLVDELLRNGVKCDDVDYVICTHGHIDHVGNLNLFTKATHIVGFSVCHGDKFYIHPFEMDMPYVIDDKVEVVPTPGHTGTDITVIVSTDDGLVAVVGDLFEREDDLSDPSLWQDEAGSENPTQQEYNRNRMLRKVNFIVPGHGPMFRVTDEMRPRLPIELEKDELEDDVQ